MGKKRELSNILILVLVGVILLAAMFFGNSDTDSFRSHCIDLNKGWLVTVNGKPYENTSIDDIVFPIVNSGDEVVLKTTLPNSIVSNPIFVFYSVHSAIKVSLDDEEIFSYGLERYNDGRMVGYGYQSIDLPDNYEGKELTVNLYVNEDAAFSSFDMPKLYDANWYVKDYLKENCVPLIINLFLIMFGICIMVIALVLIVKLHRRQWMKLLCVALFSFGIGCWSLCNYNLTFVFNDSLLVKSVLEYGSLYMLPIVVFAYFYDEVMSAGGRFRKWAYIAILGIQIIFTLMSYILQIAGVCHFPKLLRIQHLIMGFMAVYLVYMFASDIRNKRFQSIVLFVGAGVLIVFAAIDLLRFNIVKYMSTAAGSKFVGMMSVGVVIFITAMVLDFGKSIINALVEAARGRALEELAYTDALTGLANRRSCEEAFDTLDSQEEPKHYAIGVFDLNNLKKVNDVLGHEEGDAFIRAFGEILNEVFSHAGIVGRTGGDEFMVILNSVNDGQIDAMTDRMQQMIAKKNEEHANWNLSTAYGFCRYSEQPRASAKQLYKIADGRMYECKKEMKKNILI